MKLDGDVNHPQHKMMLSTVGSKVDMVAEMEMVFARSDKVHQASMEQISQSMTIPKAMNALYRNHGNSSSLKKITSLLTGGKNLRNNGFGGLDGARKLLNDMIFEAANKYDAEIMKCTAYYAEQCALMEVARGQISAANFVAATARADLRC
jgi:hypothetical protein